MQHEALDEPLEKVYVLFSDGKMEPVALLWGTRRYRVVRINSRWTDRSRAHARHGFSLTVDSGEIFQVIYEEGQPVWKLERVVTD